MASPSRATLRFPQERPSERSLDSVGAMRVLEAMVEQRRQSSIPPAPVEGAAEASSDDPDESGWRPRVDTGASEKKSIGFIKIR